MQEQERLQKQLQVANQELERLKKENKALKKMLGHAPEAFTESERKGAPIIKKGAVTARSTNDEKVALFQQLFQGRNDVYAQRWQSRAGKEGYSPACSREWQSMCRKKRKIKCADCQHRSFLPYDNQAIEQHLRGEKVIGIYPLLPDETCHFLAIDFDNEGWQEDISIVRECCHDIGLPVAVERSRSGSGAHLWFFFSAPVPATLAREFGSGLLTYSMEKRHQIGFDSYDRLFPNQDTMPKGGFGNLIALPLQREARAQGNTLFLDEILTPYPDQWQFLSNLETMAKEEVATFVQTLSGEGGSLGIVHEEEEEEEAPWKSKATVRRIPPGVAPKQLQCVLGNMIYLEKANVPQIVLNRIVRLAAFSNPEFYKAQAMRLPIYNKPRIISLADTSFEKYIAIPRGCKEELSALAQEMGSEIIWQDETNPGEETDFVFQGELRHQQAEAATALLEHETGVLAATTAFGKTVVAAWLIAQRKTNVLVIVHRRQLLDQWKDRLCTFLNLEPAEVGEISGGKEKRTGKIDVALIQSLNRKGEIKEYVRDYGMIIVDECHHISAFSFEQVLKYANSRYVYGLTATAQRKDGHQPIVFMQCGPIRFRVAANNKKAQHAFSKLIFPRETVFRMPLRSDTEKWKIHEVYAALQEDKARNELICQDIAAAIKEGFSPMVLSERTAHVEELAELLAGYAKHVIILRGGMSKKQRQAVYDKLASTPKNESRILIATGRYLGEGFDDSRLDSLFLAMPISWKGTLMQYAGRLHRTHDNKHEVRIYDYVDLNEPMLLRMYKKRLRGYANMGYSLPKNEKEIGLF